MVSCFRRNLAITLLQLSSFVLAAQNWISFALENGDNVRIAELQVNNVTRTNFSFVSSRSIGHPNLKFSIGSQSLPGELFNFRALMTALISGQVGGSSCCHCTGCWVVNELTSNVSIMIAKMVEMFFSQMYLNDHLYLEEGLDLSEVIDKHFVGVSGDDSPIFTAPVALFF